MSKYFDYWHIPAAVYGEYVNFGFGSLVLPLGLCHSGNLVLFNEIRSLSQLLHPPLSQLAK